MLFRSTPLVDLGVDSLVAVEIRTWFGQGPGIDMAVLKILGGPSLKELSDEAAQKVMDRRSAEETVSSSGGGSSSGRTSTQGADDSSDSSSTGASSVSKDLPHGPNSG